MDALLQTTPILAQTIQWKIVPGTGGVSAMTPQGSDPDLFGTNTVVRQGDRVNFDAEIDKPILRTIFETKAETRILPLAFDLAEETETRILPLVS